MPARAHGRLIDAQNAGIIKTARTERQGARPMHVQPTSPHNAARLDPVDYDTWMRISQTLQAYADALDRGDIPAILGLFTADAIWDYSPQFQCRGRDEIQAFFEERMTVFHHTHHQVASPVVKEAASGIYEASSYYTATHDLHDAGRYTVWGRYEDRLQRDGRHFLIARRRVVAQITQGTDRQYNFLLRAYQPAQDSLKD